MKWNILLAIAVVVMAYVTCKSLQKPAPAPQAEQLPVATDGGLPWNASKVIKGDNPDAAYTYQSKQIPRHVDVPWDKITKPSTSRRAFMATGWWTPKMAYQPSDTTVHQYYMGKWFRFAEDQTFNIFKDGKIIDQGHWAWDDDNKIMYLSCNDPWFNNSWLTQERGFRMVWKGNTDLNFTGIQVRMDNEPTPPWLK
ncbi:MAG: hypothetical protein KGS48_15690 [Bacteroidetes bacterium]|nr:hypothetical protein [Bacteroidota bacterium]